MEFLDKLPAVKNFIFDVDGVITDGTILVTEKGEMLRRFNMQDGFAMQYAVKQGYRVMILSGGRGQGIIERLQGLGITDVHLGVSDKLERFAEISDVQELKPEETLYMGDDLPDYGVMRKVLFAAAPANAAHEIKAIADYISPYGGGDGAVRDVIEKVLRAQEKWVEAR